MAERMSSRERLLYALNCGETDYIPMAFMIFTALRKRICQRSGRMNPEELIGDQLELGLDTFVDLRFFTEENEEIGHSDAPGFPVRFCEGVNTRVSVDRSATSRYPVIQKDYLTPSGKLSVSVNITGDWPYGNPDSGGYRLPFMDDFLAPRCRRYLVHRKNDLPALKHLLPPPTSLDLKRCRESWEEGKKIAGQKDLLLVGGWGVGADALAWFCGLQNAVMIAIEDPDFFGELIGMIDEWNRPRMEAYLDFGIDLFIRRAWYEGTDFWSPELYRQFFFPIIRREVHLAHEAGTKYGYILTSGLTALQDQLLELGIDVLIGADPVQGKSTDLSLMKQQFRGDTCIWGGINGFITVEQGTPEEIDAAVLRAVQSLGPEGLILSPVDNISDPSDHTWKNMLALIESWKKYRNIK